MTSPRFFCDSESLVEGARVPLPEEERRHVRAHRLSDGDRVSLLDGLGCIAEGVLAGQGREVVIETVVAGAGEPPLLVIVLLGVADPLRLDWAVEKGTECGAAAFHLLVADHSQEAHRRAALGRRERLCRIAREAAKQCGRSVVPKILGPDTLRDIVKGTLSRLVVASPAGPRLDRSALGGGDLVALAVGPEGGFSESEEEFLRASGAVFMGLGPRILRLETAVVVALTHLLAGS